MMEVHQVIDLLKLYFPDRLPANVNYSEFVLKSVECLILGLVMFLTFGGHRSMAVLDEI